MTRCRDIGQFLYEYVEGALPPEACRALEAHLKDCPNCLAFIRTYRKTIHLSGELHEEAIPQELKDKLRDFLKAKQTAPKTGFFGRLFR